ncbi:MAG TPA: hypothetical protein VLX56_06030 [Nitrososphaerales archaeon]|nr:hypothetical protein [Nitrososphaerales archaeon]
MIYYGGRPARIEVLLVVFSFETFVVMALILTFIVSPAPYLSTLAHTVFSTWVASLFTVLPPYLIFASLVQMVQDRGITTVVIPLGLEYGFLTFAAGSLIGYGGTFTLGNFFDFLITSARTGIPQVPVPSFTTLLIVVPSVMVYCGLLVYSTIPSVTAQVPPKVTFVIPLLAAGVALTWLLFSVWIIPNTLLSFTAPGLVIVALLWVYIRR